MNKPKGKRRSKLYNVLFHFMMRLAFFEKREFFEIF